MQRYLVTALKSITVSIEPARNEPPAVVNLEAGDTCVARRVIRIVTAASAPATSIVPHPNDLGVSVNVGGVMQLERIA